MMSIIQCQLLLKYNIYLSSPMDYQQLKAVLPKPPQKWSPADVETWLRFIGLEQLTPSFKLHGIDGSCILTLEQQDLKDELQIVSGITVKKLMAWIRTGLHDFEQYLIKNHSNEQTFKNPRAGLMLFEEMQEEKQPVQYEVKKQYEEESSFGHLELILEPTVVGEGNSEKVLVPKQGLKIGRNSSNDLVIPEAEVSRSHAEITYSNGAFYIKDLASTTGTFIKILDHIEIKVGTVIEIGSHLLQVEYLGSQGVTVSMVSEDGPKLSFQKIWNLKAEIGIGRKSTNEIFIEDDSHMSNNHAVIYYSDGRFYYKDLQTTNGSWLRLSNESSVSRPYQLKNDTAIKIGPTMTYVCRLRFVFPMPPAAEIDERLSCAVCYVNTRDCVIQPCNHSNTCMKCAKNLKECPVCRTKIDQTLKIYHF